MKSPIKILEEILLRNLPDEERLHELSLRHCGYRYFYFDHIRRKEDYEAAWSVFPEYQQIRQRLDEVENLANVIPGFGYRVPRNDVPITERKLLALLRKLFEHVGPLIDDDDSNADIKGFLNRQPTIEIAADELAIPDPRENNLFLTLYEGMQRFALEHFPPGDHYSLLRDWAIYLTKCDEVAFYLLWPCLRRRQDLSPDTPLAWFQLWSHDCRDRFWIKDNDN